jgi:hypothetical protein
MVERMEQFFVVNEVKNEKKVAVFLSVVGPVIYRILKNLHYTKTRHFRKLLRR